MSIATTASVRENWDYHPLILETPDESLWREEIALLRSME